MATDPLDDQIETTRRACEEIRALLREKEIELKALLLAASLRPPGIARRARTPRDGQGAGNGKGRQLGAISKQWRAVLQATALMYAAEGATPQEIAALGPRIGLPNLRPRDARERAEKYVEIGFMERVGDRYRVTDVAKVKFGMNIGLEGEGGMRTMT